MKNLITIAALVAFSNALFCTGGNLFVAAPSAPTAMNIPANSGAIKQSLRFELNNLTSTFNACLAWLQKVANDDQVRVPEEQLIEFIQALQDASNSLIEKRSEVKLDDIHVEGKAKRIYPIKAQTEPLITTIVGRQIQEFASDVARNTSGVITRAKKEALLQSYNNYVAAYSLLQTYLQQEPKYNDALSEMEGYLVFAQDELK